MNTKKSSRKTEKPWAELLERACRYDLKIKSDIRKDDIGLIFDRDGVVSNQDLFEKTVFLKSFTEKAIARARREELSPDADETWELIEEARKTAEEVISALSPSWEYSTAPLVKRSDNEDEKSFLRRAVWHYRMRPSPFLRTDPDAFEFPLNWPDRHELERAAQKYVESAWRHPFADRMIIRLLIEYPAAECSVALTTKKASILSPPAGLPGRRDGRSHLSAAVRPRFWLHLLGFALAPCLLPLSILIGVALLADSSFASELGLVLSPELIFWSVASSVCVALLLSFAAIVINVRKRPLIKAYSKEVVEAYSALNHALEFTDGDGPLSLSELRREADQIRDLEILPQMLFALIDLLEKDGKTYV